MPVKYLGDFDVKTITCGALSVSKDSHGVTKKSVPLTLNNGARIEFNFNDGGAMVHRSMYGLEKPKPDASGNINPQSCMRRNFTMRLDDPKLISSVEQIDENFIQIGVKNASEWFKIKDSDA